MQWEYDDFNFDISISGSQESIPVVRIAGGNPNLTHSDAKEIFWVEYQPVILPALQNKLDLGWKPLSKVGPAAIELTEFTKKVSDVDGTRLALGIATLGIFTIIQAVTGKLSHLETWCKPTEFKVKLRRKKQNP